MPDSTASNPASRPKPARPRSIYVLLLVLVSVGAAARIAYAYWENAHADEQAAKAAQARLQHKLDWLKPYLALEARPAHMSNQHPCLYESFAPKAEGPQVGECGMATSLFTEPIDRFEVDLRYGSFVLRQTDLFLNDGFAVPFTRVYTSVDWFEPNPVHAFGRNTSHTYDIAPLGNRNTYAWIGIALEDGDFLYFDRISKGAGYYDALYRHTETDGRFYKAITYWNDNGWITKLADGSVIYFPESSQAKKIADGAPIEIQDAAGSKLHLGRGLDHNLREIQTEHRHVIRLTYNDRGLISRAADDQNNWVMYLYNGNSMLVTVIYSSGKKRMYDYDGALLTAITDEEDRTLVHNIYDQGRIVAQEFRDGRTYQYSYLWSANGQYAEAASVRRSDGIPQEIETGSSVPEYVKRIRD